MFALRTGRALTSTVIQLLLLGTFSAAFVWLPVAYGPAGMSSFARTGSSTLAAVVLPERAKHNAREMNLTQAMWVQGSSLVLIGVVGLAVVVAWFSVWLICRSPVSKAPSALPDGASRSPVVPQRGTRYKRDS